MFDALMYSIFIAYNDSYCNRMLAAGLVPPWYRRHPLLGLLTLGVSLVALLFALASPPGLWVMSQPQFLVGLGALLLWYWCSLAERRERKWNPKPKK